MTIEIHHESLAAHISVVIVTFNSAGVLETCLASIPDGITVIVVDNASADIEAVRTIVARRKGQLIESPANIGYGRACNLGAEAAHTDYLFFINPDVTLAEDALVHLLGAALREPSCVAFNPRILTHGRPVLKRRSILLPRSQFPRRQPPAEDREIPVLSGAAIFVRRSDFAAVEGFDPGIVLYHEDDDLSFRLRRDRGSLMYVHDAVIEHIGGASAERSTGIQSLKSFEMGKSRIYVARKHNLPNIALNAFGSAVLQFLNPANILSARKRAKPSAYLRGILAGLRDGSAKQ